jgi:hypothetical protein
MKDRIGRRPLEVGPRPPHLDPRPPEVAPRPPDFDPRTPTLTPVHGGQGRRAGVEVGIEGGDR